MMVIIKRLEDLLHIERRILYEKCMIDINRSVVDYGQFDVN